MIAVGAMYFESEIISFLERMNIARENNIFNLHLDEFCDSILYVFERHRCVDTLITAEVLDLVCNIRKRVIHFRLYANSILWNSHQKVARRSQMIRLMKMPYMELHNPILDDPVRYALRARDAPLLSLLLRYGMAYLPQRNENYRDAGTRVLGWITRHHQIPEQDQVEFRLDQVLGLNPAPCRHRQFLLLKAIDGSVARYQSQRTRYGIQCLKMIFQTIPEPHISSAEIRQLLSRLLNREECDPIIRKVSDDFEQEFPENARVYKPRCLKHLSRCATRHNLRVAGKFPHGVHELSLPDILTHYILAMEQDDPYYIDWTHLTKSITTCHGGF